MYKIVLSAPVKDAAYTRAEILLDGDYYGVALYTATQVFHRRVQVGALDALVDELLGAVFSQYNGWDGAYQYAKRVTKKGKVLTTRTRNSAAPKETQGKNYIFREGMHLPVLVDAGIFTQEGRVAANMRDKFVQINRFVELLADEAKELPADTVVNIIDFGCGKSYLSFLVYHYFTQLRGFAVQLCGLDTDAKLVAQSNALAQKHGYLGMRFAEGDIGGQDAPPLAGWGRTGTFNLVISLHACNTATDYSLAKAVAWGAQLICAVPCCQHELREQMRQGNGAAAVALFSRYGIVQERVAALATDAIRAALLEAAGYQVQLIELTDRENTAKNILLRAKKTNRRDNGQHAHLLREEAQQLMETLGVSPTLQQLLP